MPAPQEIPGFYFDEEKNRYFPIKGPIPGRGPKRPSRPPAVEEATTSSSPSSSLSFPSSIRHQKRNTVKFVHTIKKVRTSDLLQTRELHGRLFRFNKRGCIFQQEYEKLQASHPVVWKYPSTDLISDSALQQFHVLVQTPGGEVETNVLSTGSNGGSLSLYDIGKVGKHLDYGFELAPHPLWPLSIQENTLLNSVPESIWSAEASVRFPSSISSILHIGKIRSLSADGAVGGSIYVLNFNTPLDFSSNVLDQRTSKIASFDFTIWSAACNSNGKQAALGTNRGVSLLDIENGRLSWICRTKSDTFSLQFDSSGNIVLCGLRNGLIEAVDVRQKHSAFFGRFTAPPRGTITTASNKLQKPPRKYDTEAHEQRCQMRGSTRQSATMSSAVCSLYALLSDEQYFLGSSMDGSIQLFDKRLLCRGAVQTYEGHVNSHTHIQLGVNPSETLLISGGEDCYLRIWSIKTGELIFSENVSQSILKTVCWPQGRNHINGLTRTSASLRCADENVHNFIQSSVAWMGSREGLFSVHVA